MNDLWPRVTAPVKTVIFMGSPDFAVPSLAAVREEFNVAAVYSQPPRPAGRGQQLTPTPVHAAAERLGLPVRTPERLREAALEELMRTDADALCVVGYGLLLPKALVDRRVCLNVHPSALPRWRGATPVQRALMAGDLTTDVCIMQLEAGMDTGPVFLRETVTIPPLMTAGELNATVWEIGAWNLVEVLRTLPARTPTAQSGAATLAPKLSREDRVIDWRESALAVHNRIRALSPAPGAVFTFGNEQIKVLRSRYQPEDATEGAAAGTVLRVARDALLVACGGGQAVRLEILQRPGKKALPVQEAVQGWPVQAGDCFT